MRLSVLMVALSCAVSPACATVPSARKPNVLFVIADQWRQEAFGFAGNRDVRTPAFDAFARQSIRFSNAVSSVPVCCPTRASLLTGRRALSHGVFMNDVPLDPKADTIGKTFAAAGYDTGFIGKWHVDGHGRSAYIPPERRQGFQMFHALECTHDYNRSTYYAEGSDQRQWPGYDAEAQTEDAIRFIRDRSRGGSPFFLMLSWGPPHEPYQTAPERFRKLYDPDTLALRPNVPREVGEAARRDLAGYYAHCSALDACFERLMDTLKEQKLDGDTIVVFTSDHGDMLWSHKMEKKQKPWDESCRVPLLIRYPNRFGGASRELTAPIATEDIPVTLVRMCGLKPLKGAQGIDFSRSMATGKDPSDGAVLVSCIAPFGQWPRSRGGKEFRAIRTSRYTYARDLYAPWLLYDNQADPFQQRNLAGQPEHAELQTRLDGLLKRKLKQAGDRFEPAAFYIDKWGYKLDAAGTVPYEP